MVNKRYLRGFLYLGLIKDHKSQISYAHKIKTIHSSVVTLDKYNCCRFKLRYQDLSPVQFDMMASKKMDSSILIVANLPWMTESFKITAPKVHFL